MSMSMTLKNSPAVSMKNLHHKELGVWVEYQHTPAVRGSRDEGRLLEPDEDAGICILSINLFGEDITDNISQTTLRKIEDYLIGWK